jgi:signal transduction histidine kinase
VAVVSLLRGTGGYLARATPACLPAATMEGMESPPELAARLEPAPPEPRWPVAEKPGWPHTVPVRWPVALIVLAALEVLGRFSVRRVVPAASRTQLFGPVIHIQGTATNLSTAGLVVFCVLCLLSTLPFGLPHPAAAGVVVTMACAISLEAFAVLTVAGLAGQLLSAFRLGRSGAGWSQVLALALAVPYVVVALFDPGRGEARVLAVLLAVLTPVAVLAGVAGRREAEAAGAAEQAIAGSMFEHMARGERARIARELHDVVAHHISMVSVQAETARLTVPGMPEEGARRLSEIGDTARAGLTEMRRLLGVLREDAADAGPATPATAPPSRHPQPGLAQLNELLDESRDASGSAIRLIVSGPVTALDPGVELAVYRIVQEALTNARRHAPGAAVDVELRYSRDTLLVRVRDNGPGAAVPSAPATGHGLLGMRERAQAAGGELRAGGLGEGVGFLVQASLPVQAAGPSAARPATAGSSAAGPSAAGPATAGSAA